MKKLFTILAVAAAVVACQKNETIALDNGEAISFGNAFVENSVRADYSSTDLKGFTLYGTVNNVNIYNEVAVTKGTANYGDAWTCPVQQYWIEGAEYKFAAVVDADEVIVDETTKMPTSLKYAAAGQNDMLYKYVEKTGQAKGDNDIVGFTFTHLLAKAYFTLTNNTNDTKYTYSISNVKVTNAYQNGVYAVTGDNGSWTGSNPAATNFDSIENVVYGTPKTNAAVLLIPGASVGVSFTVTLKIDNKEVTSYDVTKDAVVTPTANSVYNFNVALSPNDPIQFTVTAKPNWGDTTTVSAN
jgi:hypothetical protein